MRAGLAVLLLVACSEDGPPPVDELPPPAAGFCGDGVRSELEPCDGGELGGRDCIAAGFEGGVIACSVTCAFDLSGCIGTGPVCGDAAIAGIEQCDGSELGGATCKSLGFLDGLLACNSACGYDLSACVTEQSTAACGDAVLDSGEECDGALPPAATCSGRGFVAGELRCGSDCRIDDSLCLADAPYAGGDLGGGAGCEGAFNPEQVLTYHLDLPASDWSRLLADTTASIYFRATFRCGDGPPITVGVRRKRSGGVQKPGLKIDFNRFEPNQTYFDLRKLSFEVGASSGGTEESERKDVVGEYLANRLMTLSGAIASRSSLAELFVDGARLGVYANVEDVDKRFLRERLGDDSGWLYKKSGGDDGFRTNETMADPYEAYFCFWESNGCPAPADLATTLPQKLDLEQMLRLGAVNALIGNTDGPLFKDNNYFFYDYAGGPRIYIPWDLDTVMNDPYDVFTGGGGGGQQDFAPILFMHWQSDYDRILTELVEVRITSAVLEAELDRVLRVAGPALDADPIAIGDDAAGAIDHLRAWWAARIPQVAEQVSSN